MNNEVLKSFITESGKVGSVVQSITIEGIYRNVQRTVIINGTPVGTVSHLEETSPSCIGKSISDTIKQMKNTNKLRKEKADESINLKVKYWMRR
jgi:hypothetical protein